MVTIRDHREARESDERPVIELPSFISAKTWSVQWPLLGRSGQSVASAYNFVSGSGSEPAFKLGIRRRRKKTDQTVLKAETRQNRLAPDESHVARFSIIRSRRGSGKFRVLRST